MFEKVYKFFLGGGVLLFAIYLATHISIFTVLGAGMVMIAGILVVINDFRSGKFSSGKKTKTEIKRKDGR